MRDLTTRQMINSAADKSLRLVMEISKLKHGRDNFEEVVDLVKDIYMDQVDLINVIEFYKNKL